MEETYTDMRIQPIGAHGLDTSPITEEGTTRDPSASSMKKMSSLLSIQLEEDGQKMVETPLISHTVTSTEQVNTLVTDCPLCTSYELKMLKTIQ